MSTTSATSSWQTFFYRSLRLQVRAGTTWPGKQQRMFIVDGACCDGQQARPFVLIIVWSQTLVLVEFLGIAGRGRESHLRTNQLRRGGKQATQG